tara:strand:- start:18625 stop:19569 length:945 start_codon:yes stop_codon:yes gene_type:complete
MRPFDLSKFRKDITKNIDGISLGFRDPKVWISTGNYALNYAISGRFRDGGIPLGKVTMLGGQSGSGKSFLASGNITANAQKKDVFVVMIDTENALDESWLKALDVDTSETSLLKVNVAMIDDVARLISDFMKEYKVQYGSLPEEQRPRVLFVIDSLGMLLTPTDVNQFEAGDLKGDMGRKPKALAALVRNCVNMFGEYDIGMVCTNHSYASQDMFNPDDVISGGCLVAGTQIIMADGSVKSIEHLELNDIVQTMFGAQPVTNLWHYQKPTISLTLDDGSEIECSPEHKFLVNRLEGQIWVCATDLNPDDEILAI